MAKCVICNQFFAPGYTDLTEDGKASKCIFCEREKDTVTLQNPETGVITQYSKQEVVNEYMKYLREVSQSPDVKKLIVDDAVSKMKQSM